MGASILLVVGLILLGYLGAVVVSQESSTQKFETVVKEEDKNAGEF